ncbi:MAG: NADP-dependent malic enzyme [Alphaproteobacteria bacterium]|nr:NADP-dependent malic enzyme [Alphaproteobacteria bacterium]
MASSSHGSDDLRAGSMIYHRLPRPGKLEIQPTKPLGNQRDLALAYSPGVAAPCEAIAENPDLAAELTSRQNLVAVISNGTAVLGLGNIGPLASKPVMEGKAVLFKKFAGIDVFDIEVAENDPKRFVDVVAALEPTFGGINLEDIKAPECFEIEKHLREKMAIPVFHDDQHGTAIIVGAAVLNAVDLSNKRIGDIKIVASGAGAAALACLNLLVSLGAKRENIWVSDLEGVVYEGREKLMDPWKAIFAQKTDKRTLNEVIDGADVFLGLSAGGVLKADMVKRMAEKPLILALANPNPEIMPEEARAVRPDAMMCTGRSDYPNQVNNVLCFPYIFRGALDVGATTINEDMKSSTSRGLGDVYKRQSLIPSPFDPRLILRIAPAVAKAAIASGVARRPITDFKAYEEKLSGFVFRSGFIMKPIFEQAKAAPKRVIYADGEDERVLRAAQIAKEEGFAIPILIGRPSVIETRCQRYGLSIRPGRDVEVINPEDDPRYRDYVATLIERVGRKGVAPDAARTLVRTNSTVIAAVAVMRGDADAMIAGLEGRFHSKLRNIRDIIGLREGVRDLSAMTLMITSKGNFFLADTHVTHEPSAEDIADIAILAAHHVERFGIIPKIALVSHSDFGDSDAKSAQKMRVALDYIRKIDPDLEVDGEMQADTALVQAIRSKRLPDGHIAGDANVLIMPNLDAANIAYQLIKVLADALPVGPILIGTAKPAHILTTSVTARGVVNMTALAVVEAQAVDAPQLKLV